MKVDNYFIDSSRSDSLNTRPLKRCTLQAKFTSSPAADRQASAPRRPLVEIGARHRIEPLAQGELDSLCSLYAVINAFRLACHSSEPMAANQSKKLFALGIEYLQRKRGLEEALTIGLYTRRRLALARYLADVASSPHRKFIVERADPDLSTAEAIFRWISDSIFDGCPVLISLMGSLNHLSVAAGITDKLILLFDSGGLRHVRKSSCGVRGGWHQIAANGVMKIAVRSS